MNEDTKNRKKKLLQISQYFWGVALTWSVGGMPVLSEPINIKPNFSPDPLMVEGNSNGGTIATEIVKQKETATGFCVGFVNSQPNHILKLNSFFNFLKVEVESTHDTTIVIKGPGGIWCNDDYKGKNPAIAGQWQPGEYSIWIGSYKKDSSFPYFLKVTQNQ